MSGPALVVGLTGGIGSGKSSVARRFEALGAPTVDADAIAREIVEPGEAALAMLVDAFGPEILDASGRLDRAALRARVFADPHERERLERILHPLIRERIRTVLAGLAAPYAVVEIPLLVESGQRDLVDRILVVEASERTRIERTARRDGTGAADVERIIAAQASAAERRAVADDVIDNDGDPAALDDAVAALDRSYLALARLPRGGRR